MSTVQCLDEVTIKFVLNGLEVLATIPVRTNLVDLLRHQLQLTGSHVSCEQGQCGACTMVVDGHALRGCLMLAAQVDGRTVETIEGASESGRLRTLQEAFFRRAALQCGFCTAGILLTAAELLSEEKSPSRETIRHYLSGNYCRCTGYEAIIDAIQDTAGCRSAP